MPLPRMAAALVAAALVSVNLTCQGRESEPFVLDGLDSPGAGVSVGDQFYWAGEYDSAEVRYRSALELARQLADPATEGAATLGLGRVAYRRDHDYAAARALALEARDLQQRHGLDDQLFESVTLLGLIAYHEGRYFESVEFHSTARDLAQGASDSANLLKAWTNLALAQIELGDAASARKNLEGALALAPTHGDALREGRILLNLGMLAIRTGHPKEGVALLERGRPRMRQAGDGVAELNLFGHMGIAYAAMGEPGRAIAYLDTARTEAQSQDDPVEEASSIEQMAGVFLGAGEYPRALRLYREANDLNGRLGQADEVAANLRSIGEIYFSLDNFDLARRSVDEALETHRSVGARLNVLDDLLLLARVAQEEGDGVAAERHLDEATTLTKALDTRAARIRVALTRARIADLNNDSRGTLAAIRTVSKDLTAEGGGSDREWEAHWLNARAYARSNALGEAEAEGRQAVDAVERVRGGFGSGALRSSLLTEREEVYRDLVDVLLRSGKVAAAFEVADRARGRVLVEHLATLHGNGNPSVRELAEEQRTLLQMVDDVSEEIIQVRESGNRDANAPAKEQLERLYAEVDRIRGDYGIALTRAEERDANRMAIAGGVRPDAGRIQRALRPDEALLEYLVEPDRVLLFVVRADRVVQFSQLTSRDVLFTRVRVVREFTGRPGRPEDANPALEALHEVLLGEARRAGALAGVGTLIIVPHAELTYVPFAALRDPSTGRFLVEDFALLHLPSAATLPVLRARQVGGGSKSVAFAPFPSELPGTRAEVAAMASSLGAEVRLGGQASEAQVRAALGDAALVHLATHGVLNVRSPLFSRVMLSQGRSDREPENDGRLEVHEINRVAIGAALVFLSGCETALGAVGSTGFSTGEDYSTLERAFLQAGTANVVATLWRIEDQGSARLVQRFYAELSAGAQRGLPGGPGRLTDALSRAQREMIGDPEYGSPYYWAGFRLSGNGDFSPGVATRGSVLDDA